MDTKKPINCKVKLYYNKAKGIHYFRYPLKAERLGYKLDSSGDVILDKNGKPRYNYNEKKLRPDEYVGKNFYNSQLQWHEPDENGKLSREKQAWNKKTQEELDRMLRERQHQIDNGIIPSSNTQSISSSSDFFEFLHRFVERGNYTKNTVNGYKAMEKSLKHFIKSDKLQFFQVDNKFLKDFEHNMQNSPSTMRGINSQQTINTKIKRTIFICHQAANEGVIDKVSFSKYRYTKAESKKKDFLNGEELDRIITAPTHYPEAKRWFLFSCFTGLPIEESKNLTWGDVNDYENSPTTIKYMRKKMKNEFIMEINSTARSYMGERLGKEDKVFPTLDFNNTLQIAINLMVAHCQINKHITPHSARNTFACWFYKQTKDPLRLRNILGHKSFTTTQRYIDRCIQETNSSMPEYIPSSNNDS